MLVGGADGRLFRTTAKRWSLSPIRPAAVTVGAAAVLLFAAIVVLGNTGTRPAAPTSESPEVTYGGCYFNPSDRDVARRLAAGEDPMTIPGAVCTTSGALSPSALSSSAAGLPDETSTPTPR